MCEKFSWPQDVRDFFAACIKKLQMPLLMRIWGKSDKHIYAWATSGTKRENPLEKMEEMIGYLQSSDDKDAQQLARWLAYHFCSLVGLMPIPDDHILPDRDFWQDELMDDEDPWHNYREACRRYRKNPTKRNKQAVIYWEAVLFMEVRQTTKCVFNLDPDALKKSMVSKISQKAK